MYEFLTGISSETGKREKNEDSCAAQRIGDETYFLAVADGLGGKDGGKIASKMVISSVSDFLRNTFKDSISKNDLKGILEEAFVIAQTTIGDYTSTFPELKGMGTTLTILLLHGKKYVWGSIGDSRLYFLHDADIKLITNDHTHTADYLKSGGEELPQVVMERYRNIVTRIVDGGKDKPDIFPLNKESNLLEEGDMFLLCSDGLIVDKSIDMGLIFHQILRKDISISQISKDLIDWALENGSVDNISVVLGKFARTIDKQNYEDYKTIKNVPNNDSNTYIG
jgi:serine/threonine protein phosphatase PrpC